MSLTSHLLDLSIITVLISLQNRDISFEHTDDVITRGPEHLSPENAKIEELQAGCG